MEDSVWRALGPKGVMAGVEGEGEKELSRVMASPPTEEKVVRATQLSPA